MSERAWHFTSGGNRYGPIGEAEFRAMVRDGRVPADSHVWSDGMPQWAPLATVMGGTSQPARTQVTYGTPEVSYYSPGAGLPPRAAATLLGHARPRGDVSDWPLDDARIAQFEVALKARKRISAGAQLYKFLFALTCICGVAGLLGIVTALNGTRGGIAGTWAVSIVGGIVVGFCVLYFFAWRGTVRSQRWAPITMFVVYLLTFITQFITMFAGASTRGPRAEDYVATGFTMLFSMIFAAISWRASSSIPIFLSTPAWCQELLVKAKL